MKVKRIVNLIIILILMLSIGCVAKKSDMKQTKDNNKDSKNIEATDAETEADEDIEVGVWGEMPHRIPIDIQDTSDEFGIDFENLEPDYDLRVEKSTSYFPQGYRLVFLIYEDDNGNRLLDVVKQDKTEKYKKIVSNSNAILKANEGGVWGDPFSSMEYSKDIMKLSFYGGSSWRWCQEYYFKCEGEQVKLYSTYHAFGRIEDNLRGNNLKQDGGYIFKANFCDGIIEYECNNDGTIEKTVKKTNEIIDIQEFSIYEYNEMLCKMTEEYTEVISDIHSTEVSDIQDMKNDLAHESYIKEIERREDSEIIYDCDFTEYAFFDIDGNGIDELITSDGFFAYIIYTYSDDEIIDLLHIKRGWGEIKIYADSKCVFSKGGITDCYYNEYDKINGNKSEQLASKTWYITHKSDTEISTRYEYSVMGKPCRKKEYKDYVKSITQSKAITHKDLEWIKVLGEES